MDRKIHEFGPRGQGFSAKKRAQELETITYICQSAPKRGQVGWRVFLINKEYRYICQSFLAINGQNGAVLAPHRVTNGRLNMHVPPNEHGEILKEGLQTWAIFVTILLAPCGV